MESALDPPRSAHNAIPAFAESPAVIPGDEFAESYGETLERTLDLGTWQRGEDLARLYGELEAQIERAAAQESSQREAIRQAVFPRIAGRPDAPHGAGVYKAHLDQIESVHRKLLFNGGVEACDGTVSTHDTLAVTITQIGICLVTYHGDSGSWVHRLFRRDLRAATPDPTEAALALIERRQRRGGMGQPESDGQLSELARRGIMAYAERAVLLERTDTPWRMGHGNPVPYELLTGSGSMELLDASLVLLERLIDQHRKFVYVPTAPRERGLLTIGQALGPMEYAILDTMTARMAEIVDKGHYGKSHKDKAQAFVRTFGPDLVIGLYRASEVAPPQLFYAHADHAHEAALIALADSALQEHRGFPTLIDLADTVCRTTFGAGDFIDSVRLAYANSGEPYRYLGERETRR